MARSGGVTRAVSGGFGSWPWQRSPDRDRETERIWRGAFSRALPHDIQSTALRQLRMLNNAKLLQDLAVPPE
jgi:hypothetical protein